MQALDLSLFTLNKGGELPADQGRLLIPADDGEVILSLHGAPGALGGLTWQKDDWLTIDFCADMDRMASVRAEFEDAEGRELAVHYQMIPTCRVKMTFQVDELSSRRFFLPTYPGSYKGHVYGAPTDIGQIGTLRIHLMPSEGCRSFHLFAVTLTDEQPNMRVTGETMVDSLGQRKHAEWPDKMRDEGEMVAYLRGEFSRANASPGYPEGWSRWGGLASLRFEATGWFRTHHDGRRWWLVDPDGYAFFSNGVCYGSRMGVHGFVDRMEPLFDWLPDKADPIWADCWTTADQIPEFVKRNGAEAGRGRDMFNFARANMIRAFGADGWWDAWVTINAARMKRWGFNTIGVGVNNYGDERVLDYLAKADIPFVWTLKEFPLTRANIFRDFPDVFSPEYREGSERFAREQLAPLKDNPALIGYFITNEPEWLFQATVNPAERVLAYDGHLHSKDALIDFLKARYGGGIAAFNAAWNLSLASFDGLQKPIARADERTDASRADLEAFRDILIQKYSQVPSEALRAVDPHHLNLGMRYALLTAREFAGNGCFDICSFNCYRTTPVPPFDIVRDNDARPGLVGEWHVAGDDARNYATGLLHTHGQADRAAACRFYMEQAFAHPTAVGIHYFEMNDQPVLGRFDGECMQHGLMSLCNKPYREMEEMFAQVAGRVYPLALGEVEPLAERPEVFGRP